MTPAEQAHYENPEAVAALDEGLTDVEEGRVREGGLRTDPVKPPAPSA